MNVSKSFIQWMERYQYTWFPQFEDCEELTHFILKHTSRGTRIGKVLNKLKLEDCDAFTLQQGVIAWNAPQYMPQVEIVSDMETILEAYTDVYSCMTKNAHAMAVFLSHPMLVEQGLRVALYRQHGRITARCLVDVNSMGMLPIYSNGNMLEFHMGLTELGFTPVCGDIRVLSNKRLPVTEFIPYLDEFGGHCYFAKSPNENWCFGFPEGFMSHEELLSKLTTRMSVCKIKLDVETLLICMDSESMQWKTIETIMNELEN